MDINEHNNICYELLYNLYMCNELSQTLSSNVLQWSIFGWKVSKSIHANMNTISVFV